MSVKGSDVWVQVQEKPYGCAKCVEHDCPDCAHWFYCGEEGPPSSRLPHEAKTSGKLEPVSVGGQTLTGPQPLSPFNSCPNKQPSEKQVMEMSSETTNKTKVKQSQGKTDDEDN